MKNIILGVLGCLLAVYTIVSCLSIYSISTRKNEMENCISQIMQQTMESYYAKDTTDEDVAAIVKQEILTQLHSQSQVTIEVRACDMTNGILSIRVKEDFTLPDGEKKEISCNKTLIVEEGEIKEEEVEAGETEASEAEATETEANEVEASEAEASETEASETEAMTE
jgi:hypothetical protein